MSLIPKKGTVYVVDDDEAVRDSLQWLLEGKDYRVRCFDSAESFISRYDPREVACLIADIRMGGMTGLELQDRLIERKSPLPIVFITGHGDVPMAVTTMKKGAMDFIQKPFKEEELLSLVERMLDEAREAFAGYQQAASRDALLPGTPYHAAAEVPCGSGGGSGGSAKVAWCKAFVIRRANNSATVVVTNPEGQKRQFLFVNGKAVASDQPEQLMVQKRGDVSLLSLGENFERYEIVDALVVGG